MSGQEMDPELKAKIILSLKLDSVDKKRRYAKALTQLFEAIDPLPLVERIDLLEEVLNVLDPQPEDET